MYPVGTAMYAVPVLRAAAVTHGGAAS
jgi:hypothetical protein